jgi:hypothetical protein
MANGQVYHNTTTGDLEYQGTSGTRAVLCKADGYVHLHPVKILVPLISGEESVAVSTYTAKGTCIFNPADYSNGNARITRSIVLEALCEVTPTSSMELKLYNLTDGIDASSSLSTSSNTPTLLTTSLSNLDGYTTDKIYELQFKLTSTIADGYRAVVKSANIVLKYV